MIRSGSIPPVRCSEGRAASQRGLALLVVLWIIASATLLVSAFGVTARSGASLASSEIEMTKVEALLDAGAEIAATHLIDDREDLRWRADGRPRSVAFAGAKLKITIDDPNGFVDLNKADRKLLFGLLRQFAGSDQLAREIRDHILVARGEAPGDFNGTGQGRAREKQPDETERPVAFMDIAQLRYVEGMTLELYRQLAPYLTVYSRGGLINPLSAPDAVLSSIPDMTLFDLEKVRAYARAAGQDQTNAPPVMEKVSSAFTDETGPAYLVSVEASTPGQGYRAAKSYVLLPGFDNDAPYRLISKRPLALSD